MDGWINIVAKGYLWTHIPVYKPVLELRYVTLALFAGVFDR